MNGNVNSELQGYIENNIFPLYFKNDEGHNIEHIKYVIKRSLNFARTIKDIDYSMVFTIAAYHDIGHHIDKDNHEKVSADILLADDELKQFFIDEQIKTMAEAIEDHRASLEYEPRSIYGKIVSSADRNTILESPLRRTYTYRLKHTPNATLEQIIEESRQHILEKFGTDGYAREKIYFEDLEYKQFLIDITELAQNKEAFIKRYLEINNMREIEKGGLRAFLSLKFYDGDVSKKLVDDLTKALAKVDIHTFAAVRDIEKYGEVKGLDMDNFMPKYAFPEMQASDLFIVEFSEKGVGLGMGAAFCFAKGVPVYIIAKTGSDISTTINSVAEKVVFYETMEDITRQFKELIDNNQLKTNPKNHKTPLVNPTSLS